MRHQIIEIGREARAHMVGAEEAIDTGLMAHMGLLTTLLEARLKMGLAACVERELIADVGSMITEGLAYRERQLTLHDRTAELGERIGLSPRAFGDSGEKRLPPSWAGSDLSIVGGRDAQAA